MFHHGKVINQKNQARGDPTQEREKGIPTITKILMGYDCHKAGPKDFRRDFLFFFGRFQSPPVDSCSTASCDSGTLTRRDEHMSYSAILNQSLQERFLQE